ncbi:MAG: SurA N-terminal domain-containing protein, partial [Bacteroidales bacterium]|nr:SurA N-terminal domain-containing protein [Bacteroidales bacterium]
LSSIRSRGKLIAICVGGALLAFVLGDFISSGATIFGASQTKMGDINGNTIDYVQFQQQVESRQAFMEQLYGRNALNGNVNDEVRDYVWQQAVRENTILKNANDQGVIVTDAEIANLVQTGYVTGTIRQMFSDPQTGIYDPLVANNYIQQGRQDKTIRFIWQNLENELRQSRQMEKYLSMVNAGMYVTTAEVEREFAQRTQISDIKYVSIPYSDIKDEEVNVSEDKIKAFYNENIKRYVSTSETRDLSYVVFDVIPTDKDSAEALKIANSIKPGLESATPAEIESFINSKSDVPYAPYHYSKGDLSNPTVDEMMFSQEPGFVYGPYVEGEYYNLARLISRDMRPDSVEVSHILLALNNPADSLTVKAKADSLLGVYNSGVDFGALAAQFNEGGAPSDSGKVGWLTERSNIVPEFLNASFATEKGKTTIVRSAYGYHIIKVTDKTAPKQKVSVGIVSVDIRPSDQTRQAAYAKASEFAGRNRTRQQFEQAVTEQKLPARVAPGITSNTSQIPGIENSREIIRDAFNEEKSQEVSGVYEMGDRFIVAVMTGVHPKGTQSLASVKNEVTRLATNDAKGDAILSKLGSVSSVDEAANKMGKEVKDATSVHLDMVQIPGIGFEPKVIAAAAALQQGQVSAPIKGENGVYVLQNTSFTPAQAIQPINVKTDRTMMESDLKNRASYQAYQSIIDQANITDQRVKFY